MQNHRLNGQGTLTYDNGDTYTGGFKMVLLMVKELLNLTKVGLMKESSSLVKQMAKENWLLKIRLSTKENLHKGFLKDEN